LPLTTTLVTILIAQVLAALSLPAATKDLAQIVHAEQNVMVKTANAVAPAANNRSM